MGRRSRRGLTDRASGGRAYVFESDAVENGSTDVTTVASDRYTVERHAVSVLTSARGHYATAYCFVTSDEERGAGARMGTVFHRRFHDRDALVDAFSGAGLGTVAVLDEQGPMLLHAVK